jgi:hypothetical protein
MGRGPDMVDDVGQGESKSCMLLFDQVEAICWSESGQWPCIR